MYDHVGSDVGYTIYFIRKMYDMYDMYDKV